MTVLEGFLGPESKPCRGQTALERGLEPCWLDPTNPGLVNSPVYNDLGPR